MNNESIMDSLDNLPKKESNFQWINIICMIIFIGVCIWMILHNPCDVCKVKDSSGVSVSCSEIMQTYLNYKNTMSSYQAKVATGQKYFDYNNLKDYRPKNFEYKVFINNGELAINNLNVFKLIYYEYARPERFKQEINELLTLDYEKL
jgi:hypothetical protein